MANQYCILRSTPIGSYLYKTVSCFLHGHSLIAILFAVLLILHEGVALGGQATQVRWSASIRVPSEQVGSFSTERAKLSATLDTVRARGVSADIADDKIELSGDDGIDQVRGVLFGDTSAGDLNFLGGPVELTMTLPPGEALITLRLQSRASAGYLWQLDSSQSGYVQEGETIVETPASGLGAPSVQTLKLRSDGTGDGTVRLIYTRPFDRSEPVHASLDLQIEQTDGLIDLTDPNLVTVPPQNTPQSDAAEIPVGVPENLTTLPSSYDSRTLGIVPPIRNQGSCGTCWSFATVGIMEIALAKSGGALTDLSEQYLVSCNNDGWSRDCDVGGRTANKYHYNTLGIAQTIVGAVLESAKPYTASAPGTCSVAYFYFVTLNSWILATPARYDDNVAQYLRNVAHAA